MEPAMESVIEHVSQGRLLVDGVKLLNDALEHFMEVKSEIGCDLANKLYKALRAYEKYEEKQLKLRGVM